MHEACAITTASRPCICSWVSVEGSSRLPPGWVDLLDFCSPSIAAARLSAGQLVVRYALAHLLGRSDPACAHEVVLGAHRRAT